jgi:acetylornithine deacetylase/succinyl-diaminopimelate desuccinylase-like protein
MSLTFWVVRVVLMRISAPSHGYQTGAVVNIGTMLSGGITPFMHPESMTAIVEVRVIEGMTLAGVHDELRSALAEAGLADRVEIAAADPPHDWVPPSSAAGADRLTSAAAAAMRSVLGAEPRPGVLLGVTDFCWLTEAGIPTCPPSAADPWP